MTEEIFKEIKTVISILSILQSRQNTLRKELNFFNEQWNNIKIQQDKKLYYVGALKRLEHEVMFLCIETYSLHEGIQKQKSLYSKIIKNNGKLLSKIDKTPIDYSTHFFTILDNGKERQPTEEEKNMSQEIYAKEKYKQMEKLRNDFGIISSDHFAMDIWINKIIDKEVLAQLAKYRDEFAHRLNNLDKLKRELQFTNPDNTQFIKEMLNIVLKVLATYKECLQNILVYTKSSDFEGITNFKYDSLSRLKLAKSILDKN